MRGFNAVIAPDQLAARFSGVRQEREGYIDVNPGRPDCLRRQRDELLGGRGQLLWQPTQDVSLRIVGDYAERKDECCSAVTVFNGGERAELPFLIRPHRRSSILIEARCRARRRQPGR